MADTHFTALLPIYLEEATERLGSLGSAVDSVLTAPTDHQAWHVVRRSAHALAGNSAMMGLAALADVARRIELRAAAVEDDARAGRADALFVNRGVRDLRRMLERVAQCSQLNG
jgi:HPt (histidine-containing phosphotransfer) domain-containing protein